jgi:hypothetical protein
MGYISYPRSAGERLDHQRAQEINRLIAALTGIVTPSTLSDILALINLIGWHNLPPHIKVKLLALLRNQLYLKLDPQVTQVPQEQQAYRSNIQALNSKMIEIGLSLVDNISSPLHERLNLTGVFDFRLVRSRAFSSESTQLLIDSSGMALSVVSSSQEAVENQGAGLINAIYEHPYDGDILQKSYLGGKYSTYDALKEYRQKLPDDKGGDKYDLGDNFPYGLLEYKNVRTEIFRSVNRPCDIYREMKKIKMPGNQRDHFLAHNLFLDPIFHVKGKGRSEQINIAGAGNYHDKLSITVRVHDDQTFGTEHRFITDQTILHARRFQAEERQGTLSEWLVCMEESYVKLLNCSLIRDKSGVPTGEYSLQEAKTVARAIATESRLQFESLGVKMDLLLSNKIADLRKVKNEYPFEAIKDF